MIESERDQSKDSPTFQSAPFTFCDLDNIEATGVKRKTKKSQEQKGSDENNQENLKRHYCMHMGCARFFTSKFKLLRHLLIHSGERRFECNSCGRRFHRKDHLKNHSNVHDPNKAVYTCETCQKTYCSILSYRKHLAYHSAESGNLKCRLCDKIFPDRDSILQHLKVHSGSRTLRGPNERKFQCHLCERAFFTKKDVKRHLVVHTGSREHGCDFCPQRFGRKDHLKRHERKTHGAVKSRPPGHIVPKYETGYGAPPDSLNKGGPMNLPPSLPDISRLSISTPTVPSLLEPTTIIDGARHDSVYSPHQSGVSHHGYAINHLSPENSQNLSNTTVLPVSQYLPMVPSYHSVTSILPPHYLNVSTSPGMLTNLGPDVLPPMAVPSSFSTSASLDMGNPPLPHFNQAFQ